MDDIIKDFHDLTEIPPFQQMISDKKYMDTEEYLDVLQMNIGRKCNLICKHCHVNAGPARTEEMSREVMDACLTFAKEQKIVTIDITGGAPEMNPHLEYLIEESSKICGHVIVRTNLVILLEKEYEHLMEVYARNKVEVVCSLPYYRAPEMDKVRGAGAFDKAIKVIRRLNAMGYGRNPELVLNMVYNPAGAFFPPDQEAMEKEYKQKLLQDFGIEFNSLYTLYNNPMGRFGAFLRKSGNLILLLRKLCDKLPDALEKIAPVLIYPVAGILGIGLLMNFAIEPVMGAINTALNNGLTGMGGSSKLVLGLILGGMMAIDMGGPFNKAAYAFGIAAIAAGNYDIMAAVMIGGMTPPCAIALATLLFKDKFTKSEREAGPTNFIMGLAFITEGAIPYAAADPLHVLPACIAGSAAAGALSMAFGCTLMAPHGGIFVFPVVGNAIMYLVALVAGTVISAILLGVLKKKII